MMRRGLLVIGCVGVLGVVGCSSQSSGTPQAVSTSPPGAAVSTSTTTASATPSPSGPRLDQVGGEAYAPLALTVQDVPAGYTALKGTAEQAEEQAQSGVQNSTVTPPGCGTVSPISPNSAKGGLLAAFGKAATQEAIAEFLAPAAAVSLPDLKATALRCASLSLSAPQKGVQLTGRIEVIDVPHVAADQTLGLRTTTITTVAGSPPVTVVQTNYIAETKATLVSLNAKGGPSGAPLDPATSAAAFTTAVQKANANR